MAKKATNRLQHTNEEILDQAIHISFETEKENALAVALQITMTVKEYKKIVCRPCQLCNAPPTIPLTARHKRSYIDRINGAEHFTPENSIASCRQCMEARRRFPFKWLDRALLIRINLGKLHARKKAKRSNA